MCSLAILGGMAGFSYTNPRILLSCFSQKWHNIAQGVGHWLAAQNANQALLLNSCVPSITNFWSPYNWQVHSSVAWAECYTRESQSCTELQHWIMLSYTGMRLNFFPIIILNKLTSALHLKYICISSVFWV